MLGRLRELLGDARRVAVVTHRRADADALACAKILELVLKKMGVEVVAVVCPEGSPLGGCVEILPTDVDLYILADVASLSQVPPLPKRFFKVDHHYAGDEVVGICENRPSCTEVALELAGEAGVDLPLDVIKLAALGIYTDTGRLKRADYRTLLALSQLLKKSGGVFGDLVKESEERRDVVAILKGLRRVEAYKSSLGIICTSHVGAHESDLASLLVSLGCRVAIVASRKRDGVHVVMRSSDFDVATLAKNLGAGGGHREAAVAVIPERLTKSQLPDLLRKIVRSIDPQAELIE
ncbi:MAG: DHH family phosphoesterase [Pyrobaculum sp.]